MLKEKKKTFSIYDGPRSFYSVIKIERIPRRWKIAHRHASSVRSRSNYRFVPDIPYVRRTCLYPACIYEKEDGERVAFHLPGI